MKLIRDPVHEYIELSDEEARLIDTPLFQRLRHIAQNGPTRLVYPSLLGTRFEHTLGVVHVATKIFDSVFDQPVYEGNQARAVKSFLRSATQDLKKCLGVKLSKTEEVKPYLRKILRFAAFFHDVGHLPLSHVMEEAFVAVFGNRAWSPWMMGMKWHEVLGAELVRQKHLSIPDPAKRGAILILIATGQPGEQAKWKRSKGQEIQLSHSIFGTLRSILVGEYDADRADYMLRDGHLSGAGFGTFDLQRFVGSMRLVERTGQRLQFQILPTVKALSVLEATLIERYKLYKWVYYHHKVTLFSELVYRVGRDLFSQENISSHIHFNKPISRKSISSKISRALVTPNKALPAFIAFPIGSGKKWGELSPDFYFPGNQTYLDDAWLCQQLRSKKSNIMQSYKEALTFRKPICISMWKEYSQFNDFIEKVQRLVPENWKLQQKKVKIGSVENFLKRPWQFLRKSLKKDEDRLIDWRRAFIDTFEKKLKNIPQVHRWNLNPIVRCNDWHLFGELSKLEVLDRDGNPEAIKVSSPILNKLSGLPDNLPFFLFFLGSKDSEQTISKLKQMKSKRTNGKWRKFEKDVAKSLMDTIIDIAEDRRNKQWSAPLVDCLTNLSNEEKEDEK